MRHWLVNFYAPDRLVNRQMRALLRAHGRSCEGSRLAIAAEAKALLREKIEAIQPPEEAPLAARRPYVALLGYVQGDKMWVTARMLGISMRQTSRERARGLALLRAELEQPDLTPVRE